MIQKLIQTDDSKTTILIRYMVGCVFISEGIQKFLFAEALGAGRFEKIGLPFPTLMGNVVGSFEIICGLLLLAGFFTRLAAVPLLVIMLTAIFTTKVNVFINEGFWGMMHGSRTDWSMLVGIVFLLVKGSGRWSLDKWILGREK